MSSVFSSQSYQNYRGLVESSALKNWCFWTVVLEKTLESSMDCKEIQPVHSKGDQPWDFFGRNDAETPVLWPPHEKSWLIGKDSDAGAGGEGDDRGWDGWMASLTRCAWVWVNFRSWWWTGRPGVLWFMGSQRVGHDWATELNWTEWCPEEMVSFLLSFLLLFHKFMRFYKYGKNDDTMILGNRTSFQNLRSGIHSCLCGVRRLG